jgi:hypothetical protein
MPMHAQVLDDQLLPDDTWILPQLHRIVGDIVG